MTDTTTATAESWAASLATCPHCGADRSKWWQGAPWHYLSGCNPRTRRRGPSARPRVTRPRSTRQGTSHRDAEILALTRVVKGHRRYGAQATPDAVAAALDLWHQHAGELSWARPAGDGGGPVPSWPGEVGMARWALLRSRAGLDRDPLAGCDLTSPAWTLARAITRPDDDTQPYRHDYSWVGGELDAGEQFSTWDVVGQYLAASRCDVGRGEPLIVPPGAAMDSMWDPRLPGYVRLGRDWIAPDVRLGLFRAGSWVHTAVAKYLQVDRGWTPPWDQAVLWPARYRPLDAWGEPFRALLGALHSDPSLPARLACLATKRVYTMTLGGMLRSRRYARFGYQPDTAAAIEATGWANVWRAWDKTFPLSLRHLFGGRRDTVWVAGAHDAPPALKLAGATYQPGTWQRERWGTVDAELAAAHRGGRYARVNSEIIRINRQREASS